MRDVRSMTQRNGRGPGAPPGSTGRVHRLFTAPLKPWTAALLAAGFVLVLPYLAPAFGVPTPPRSVAIMGQGGPAACPSPGGRQSAIEFARRVWGANVVSHSEAAKSARCVAGPGAEPIG
jgi:hypothetical protein